MELYLFSYDPEECVTSLCDVRLRKGIEECGKLLTLGYRHHFQDDYKKKTALQLYNFNLLQVKLRDKDYSHVYSQWIKDDLEHYIWVVNLFACFMTEVEYRWSLGQLHKDMATELYDLFGQPVGYAGCFSEECEDFYFYHDLDKTRIALTHRWLLDKKEPTWTKRGKPAFFNVLRMPRKKDKR